MWQFLNRTAGMGSDDHLAIETHTATAAGEASVQQKISDRRSFVGGVIVLRIPSDPGLAKHWYTGKVGDAYNSDAADRMTLDECAAKVVRTNETSR